MWQRQSSMPFFIRYNSNDSNNLVIANNLGLRYTRQDFQRGRTAWTYTA